MRKIVHIVIIVITVFTVLIPAVTFAAAKTEPVRLGIDNIDQYQHLFAGKRVGLITNQTGVNSQLQSTIDVLYEKTDLVALFSPEHGLRGNAEAGADIAAATDMRTGLPVYSLYGDTKKPTAQMLENIDVLCFDIQDVGTRFYTYMSTMALAMESAKEQNKLFVVFDRPNPIGGLAVEGPVLKPGFESFIGMYPIPIRHGMTIGELALLFNKQFGIECNLQVVKLSGWQRNMFWQDTGLPWVMTSPNIPTPETALVYPGTGLLGATTISEGVGTTRPFELVGAAWLNAAAAADRLNERKLPGAYFRPTYFTPRFGRHNGINQGGVQIHVVDKAAYRPVLTAVTILEVMKGLSGGQFAYQSERMFDLPLGEDTLRLETEPLDQLLTRWDQEARDFQVKSRQYYLY
ncbi:DUF1343 domain-containing protein [Anaerospora sp.]|uniref:exo-beta-N-acetylmuramidase NamZ family protein n=1 Tax=Anaerospora sp. TaxID=1960278 RepID=UPI0028973A15|nr:DUF1343 domain-containing protein [Anaerospora sp.]